MTIAGHNIWSTQCKAMIKARELIVDAGPKSRPFRILEPEQKLSFKDLATRF